MKFYFFIAVPVYHLFSPFWLLTFIFFPVFFILFSIAVHLSYAIYFSCAISNSLSRTVTRPVIKIIPFISAHYFATLKSNRAKFGFISNTSHFCPNQINSEANKYDTEIKKINHFVLQIVPEYQFTHHRHQCSIEFCIVLRKHNYSYYVYQ